MWATAMSVHTCHQCFCLCVGKRGEPCKKWLNGSKWQLGGRGQRNHVLGEYILGEYIWVSKQSVLQPFYGSLDFVRDNPGEPVPKETFTHWHLSWSSIIPYLLPSSVTIHVILPVQLTCLNLFPQSLQVFFGLPHTPYISSPNHWLLFTAHAHTIATCFAVVPKLSFNYRLSLNPLLGTLSCSLMPHIHVTILICAR